MPLHPRQLETVKELLVPSFTEVEFSWNDDRYKFAYRGNPPRLGKRNKGSRYVDNSDT
jgi:hypothetical protein